MLNRIEQSSRVLNVSVIGGSHPDDAHYELAYRTGKLLAGIGAVTFCGGLTGVMEAVAKGVSEGKGICVGLLPGDSIDEGNRYLSVKIPTGIGFARNFLVVRAGEVVVAIDGASGTMSELYFALSTGRNVLALGNVPFLEADHAFGRFVRCESPEEVVKLIPSQIEEFRSGNHGYKNEGT